MRKLLASAGLTLHSASLESERLYGVDSPFRIPHTLYHFLDTSPVFRPNLHQVAALSRISGYSFEDWLMALDLDLERLAAASSLLAAKRTRIIDPSLEIFEYVLPGLGEREKSTSAVLPFAELLQGRNAVRARVDPDRPRPSVFARLGSDDAFAYPELQPGSIVRVNLGTSVHRDRTAAQLGCTELAFSHPFEKRYPLLDRDLLEFLFSVPREQLVRPGQRRSLMRRALRGIVPEEILGRRRKAYVTRAPLLIAEAQYDKWSHAGMPMISETCGYTESGAFLNALHAARQGRNMAIIPLLRTIVLEEWLGELASAGWLKQGALGAGDEPRFRIGERLPD